MRPEPATDHLALWRGIDDAIWRESARPLIRPMPRRSTAMASLPERAPQPAAPKVPERV